MEEIMERAEKTLDRDRPSHGRRNASYQASDTLATEAGALDSSPLCVGVARFNLATRQKKAFGRQPNTRLCPNLLRGQTLANQGAASRQKTIRATIKLCREF